MSQTPDVQRHLYAILETACAALDKAGIPYAVAGGLAAGFWGESRTTIDVDLVIAASPDEVEAVKQVFDDDPTFLFDTNDFAFPDTVVVRIPEPRVAPVARNRGRAAMRGCFGSVDHTTVTANASGNEIACNLVTRGMGFSTTFREQRVVSNDCTNRFH